MLLRVACQCRHQQQQQQQRQCRALTVLGWRSLVTSATGGHSGGGGRRPKSTQPSALNRNIRLAAVRQGLCQQEPSQQQQRKLMATDGSVRGGVKNLMARVSRFVFDWRGRSSILSEAKFDAMSKTASAVTSEAISASPEVLTSPSAIGSSSLNTASDAAEEDAEEADMRHAEEVISSIDADHRLIELAPEPSSAEMRLREQKLAHIAGLTVPGMVVHFKDHWDARMLGKGMRANHVLLCYFSVISPGNLAICKWQGMPVAIRSGEAMNRALDRDQVAVHLLPVRHWTFGLNGPTVESELKHRSELLSELVSEPVDIDSSFMSIEQINSLCQAGLVMSGEVVRIVSSFNNKCFVGSLSLHRSGRVALFKPRDRRAPLMLVPVHPLFMGLEVKRQLTQNLAKGLAGETYTVAVKMVDWPSHLSRPVAEVLPMNTDLATIEGATQAILVETGIDERPFPLSALADVPKTFYISRGDRKDREDFTDRCVVSIDPATARDLDDALHVKPLGNGCFEVGVHIADVSHFVPPESALDREARRRSTSVYLVQRVIPMLPETLSNGYCSLLPGEEKLTFSVIFQIDTKGDVASYRFAKSIIRPCCRLSYEEAEQLLESDEFLPQSVSQPFTGRQVRTAVRQLQNLAKKFRKQRLANGAFGFSVAKKLQFTCPDGPEGAPQLMKEEEAESSHQLVEEWMLKANVAAAETLVKSAPEVALLRRHPPPKDPLALADTLTSLARDALEKSGGAVDTGVSKFIVQSAGSSAKKPAASATETMLRLNNFLAEQSDDVHFRSFAATLAVMQMSLAEYICIGYHPEPDSWRHFALQFPVYTHFTSPIRRYADLLVHRQLAAAISQQQQQQRADQVEAQAMWCNRWRISAKRASERSVQMFYAAFLRSTGPNEGTAYVKSMGRQGMDLMVPQLLLTTRLDFQRAQQAFPGLKVQSKHGVCSLHFPATDSCPHRIVSTLNFRSALPVYLEASEDNLLQVVLRLRRPDCPKCNSHGDTIGTAPSTTVAESDDDDECAETEAVKSNCEGRELIREASDFSELSSADPAAAAATATSASRTVEQPTVTAESVKEIKDAAQQAKQAAIEARRAMSEAKKAAKEAKKAAAAAASSATSAAAKASQQTDIKN